MRSWALPIPGKGTVTAMVPSGLTAGEREIVAALFRRWLFTTNEAPVRVDEES